jgi:hypothetical protein
MRGRFPAKLSTAFAPCLDYRGSKVCQGKVLAPVSQDRWSRPEKPVLPEQSASPDFTEFRDGNFEDNHLTGPRAPWSRLGKRCIPRHPVFTDFSISENR